MAGPKFDQPVSHPNAGASASDSDPLPAMPAPILAAEPNLAAPTTPERRPHKSWGCTSMLSSIGPASAEVRENVAEIGVL